MKGNHLYSATKHFWEYQTESFDIRVVVRKKTGLCGKNSQTGGGLTQTHLLMSTYQVILGMPKWFWGAKTCFTKRWGGDIWSILPLNDVFFLGKMERTHVAEGGFTYSHNIISIYHPKWWFFGEDQKCSWGPKMKNKPNFFFDNRGFPNWGEKREGGSATWEFFPHNPVFFW